MKYVNCMYIKGREKTKNLKYFYFFHLHIEQHSHHVFGTDLPHISTEDLGLK